MNGKAREGKRGFSPGASPIAKAAAWVSCAALGLSSHAVGAATLLPLLANGPSSNRVDVVFLSEGYTSTQNAKFLSDTTNALNLLLSQEPFNQYRGSFNAFAIFVASNQSGSDHGTSKVDTYFNSSYDPVSDYIITIPTSSLGQGRVDALIQSLIPESDLEVLLVNDPNPGGSDGFGQTVISSAAPGSNDILLHEIGHVFAGLGDEYETPYPGFPDVEEPNTTRETARDRIKWKAWINPGTPVPTPETFDFMDVVGLFEGAHYHSTGWYRPKLDCRMNHPAVPAFCEVCREALVLSVLKWARPIDGVNPKESFISVTAGQTVSFQLNLLQPAAHALYLQWYENGAILPGQTSPSLTLPTASFLPGTNFVSVVTRDPTDMVRTDPLGLTSQTHSWTVRVNATPQVRLDSPGFDAGGSFFFRISGPANTRVIVQRSTTLLGWANVDTNILVQGQLWFTNSGAQPSGFFRASVQ